MYIWKIENKHFDKNTLRALFAWRGSYIKAMLTIWLLAMVPTKFHENGMPASWDEIFSIIFSPPESGSSLNPIDRVVSLSWFLQAALNLIQNTGHTGFYAWI